MTQIMHHFDIQGLPGDPSQKTALLINPPVYDTQYWAQWSQPYGLLRIAALLKKHSYKRLELFDFMETSPNGRRKVHQHRINPDESYAEQDEPSRPVRPYLIEKNGEQLKLFNYHFGKTWKELDDWLQAQGFTVNHSPDEIFISAIMTYWWESVRDLTLWLKHRFPPSTIILGGIYPTLVPQHAAQMTAADIVVVGEVEEANDLWTDLSLYEKSPKYAIITPSRGCPYNCAYCAQRTINNSRRTVHFRSPADIVAEMRHKYKTYGIREFAFYADFLLWDHEQNIQKVLEILLDEKLPFKLHAPEGLDVRYLSQSQRLLDLMKAARFEKLYLPCESIDDQYLRTLNRHHTRLEHFVRAVRMCERAGFQLRNMDVNAFVLYGLPGETIDWVVKTILFISEIVGSITPMLFTPVPTTQLYNEHLPYFQERGWDQDLHMLNGKLYPFLAMNEGSVEDYIDLKRLMFTLNTHYRSRSFQIFDNTRVSAAFRDNLNNGFEAVIHRYGRIS
jgi:hypothetical protein